jgi:predicted DNA-binding transcriptional regulator YafY
MTYRPTTRVLAALELLQARGSITGPDLARRLEVHLRTARRYVEILRDLGVPVASTPGRHGAYAIQPGYKLPPLLFTEEEAFAITLGLRAASRLGLAAAAASIESAHAKVERALPHAVRERVQAVAATVVMDVAPRPPAVGGAATPPVPPDTSLVATLCEGVRAGRRVRLRYRAVGEHTTERELDPYGLVYRRGYWYLTGHCHLRSERRLLRLDRIEAAALTTATFVPPENFDALLDVEHALAAMPWGWQYEVLLDTSLEEARRCVPAVRGSLTQTSEGVLLRGAGSSYYWTACILAGLGLPLKVLAPDGLRDALRRHVLTLVAQL